MKLFRTLLLIACAFSINSIYAQNLMNIHQGNGTFLQIPLESIDSVRFYTIPPPTIQKIFQSNGNILSIAVSDIDSITYTIPNNAALASISTQAVTVLSSSSAYSGGAIASDGGSAIIQRGVCWSTSPNPTLANNFSIDGSGTGSFGSNLFPLQSSTSYYVRAYAVNADGTAYGNQLTFTTASPSTSGSLATVSTANVVYIDGEMASCGGNITADGGLAVTARGICWAIGITPTINNSITIDGAGGGSYSSTLTNLFPNTSYFVRAYATNDAGTAYGITYSFTTSNNGIFSNPGAGVNYNGYTYRSVVLSNGQEWMAENLQTASYRNGDPILTALDEVTWDTTTSGAFAIYNNDLSNNAIYGKLYNWYAVADSRHLCPVGWREPTVEDWDSLANYLGGASVAGRKMKTLGVPNWSSPNLEDSTNESGFSGLPGGVCSSGGVFSQLGEMGRWWSISEYVPNGPLAWPRYLDSSDVLTVNATSIKFYGLSVRCIKN